MSININKNKMPTQTQNLLSTSFTEYDSWERRDALFHSDHYANEWLIWWFITRIWTRSFFSFDFLITSIFVDEIRLSVVS